jgi:hypothetical protein
MGKPKLRASASVRRPAASEVVVRNVLDDLAPSMRTLALQMSRDGTEDGRPEPSRIVVTGRGSFEVMPVGWTPHR